MITACAAVANGGYVLQPYVVSKITDSDGNVVKTVEKTVKRQGASMGETEGRNMQQITPDFIIDTNDDGTITFSLNRIFPLTKFNIIK